MLIKIEQLKFGGADYKTPMLSPVYINLGAIVAIEPYKLGGHDHYTILLGAGENDNSYNVTPSEFKRILPLLTDTPAAAVVSGPDTLEFSRLMYTWYKAKCVLDEARKSHLTYDAIQAEKDAYFAVVEYIKHAPPALPQEVVDAYKRWEADFLDPRAMNGMIARIQDHLPSRKQESES